MEALLPFLNANKKDLVDLVENKPNPAPPGNTSFQKLVDELVELLPMSKGGVTGVTDKAHIELANAITEAMWCGWLSQAKANDGRYAKQWPDLFEEAIIDAIKIGRAYSLNRK